MGWKDRVKTVVLVMLENRSFDHVLGHLGFENLVPGVDGLEAPLSRYENAYQGALFHPFPREKDDPLASDLPHEYDQVAAQLAPTPGGPITMGGFVSSYAAFRLAQEPPVADVGPEPDPMSFFPSGLVPVTSFLARSFCTCDRWHSSMPTSTQPNRTMAWSGESSIYDTSTGLRLIDTEGTVLDWLVEQGCRWRVYHDGLSFFALYPRAWGHLLGENFSDFEDYLRDMKEATPATAPQVIIVEPSYQNGPHIGQDHPNDNHAPLSMGWGEDFLRRTYEAATANPDIWAQTVLVVYYDEHGGFYDHVAPPAIAYQTTGSPGHLFPTLGPRVPAIVASPLVRPGSVCHALLDHTSVLQFLAEAFGDGPYSTGVDARRAQGIVSLSAALSDEPQRTDIPVAPSLPIPVATALGEGIATPPRTAAQATFEYAARQLLEQRYDDTARKYPELVHWKAAVDAARRGAPGG